MYDSNPIGHRTAAEQIAAKTILTYFPIFG
jgi:hypothetical protein